MSASKVYKLTVISPALFDFGRTLIEDRDFVRDKGRIHILDMEKLFAIASQKTETYNTLLDHQNRLGFFLQKSDIKPHDISLYSLPCEADIKKFAPFTRNTSNVPEISGSTLKGALRTALLWAIAHEEGRVRDGYFLSNDGKRAIENLLSDYNDPASSESHKLSGRRLEGTLFTGYRRRPTDPANTGARWEAANADLMRAFSVCDAVSQNTDDATSLFELRVLSLAGRNKYNWKQNRFDNARKNSANKFISSFFEAAKPGAEFTMKIKTDSEFLLDEKKGAVLGLFREPKKSALENWLLETLLFASEVANEEMQFFANLGIKNLAYFYQDLVNEINEADEKTTTYIRIGKGVGWSNISGRFLRGENLKKLRNVHPSLRGRDHMPFPKTRKILMQNEEAYMPPGWVKLEAL